MMRNERALSVRARCCSFLSSFRPIKGAKFSLRSSLGYQVALLVRRVERGTRMASTPVDALAQQKKLAFSILEYLQDVRYVQVHLFFQQLLIINRSSASADVSESLEVAIQCLSDAFDVSLTNEEHKSQYSIQPLTLPSAFGLGLARKEQIESALAVCNKRIVVFCCL